MGKKSLKTDASTEFSKEYSMTANASNKLIIFDTTLRDGEQSPGAFNDEG